MSHIKYPQIKHALGNCKSTNHVSHVRGAKITDPRVKITELTPQRQHEPSAAAQKGPEEAPSINISIEIGCLKSIPIRMSCAYVVLTQSPLFGEKCHFSKPHFDSLLQLYVM